MLLAKFKSAAAAFHFRKQLNGKPFPATEEEAHAICRILFVDKIEFHMSEEPDYFSVASGRELPLCAICLERLDTETSGIFTPICRHALHLSCKRRLDHSRSA